jgi:hypothetical protein
VIFTVRAAAQTKAGIGQRGDMQEIALTLLQDGSSEPKAALWFTKGTTPLPGVGEKLEGELEQTQFGLKFKKAGGWSGGGGGGRKDTPETRRSIAMQHAQKCAVSVLAVAAEHGEYTPPNVGDVAKHVKTVAQALYLQVMDAENDRIRAAA